MNTPVPSPEPKPTPPGFSSPGCGEGCGCSLDRRTFLGQLSAGLSWMAASAAFPAVAGPFVSEDFRDHYVPADKKLQPDWVKMLTARGERTWYGGDDLRTIGMPVGGVCAGQVYLSGEGRLVYWDVFNRNQNTGYGAVNYKAGRLPTETVVNGGGFAPALDLKQGFAVRVESRDAVSVRALDRSGFSDVRFCGEYPMGWVQYRDPDAAVAVDLEAFSPFVPLDTLTSTLPATLLRYTVRNVSKDPVRCTLAGWLENRVCPDSGPKLTGLTRRVNRLWRSDNLTGVGGSLEAEPGGGRGAVRPPTVFADFEGGAYGLWRAEGEAFGAGPARGGFAGQQPVSGYAGEGLVNSFLGGSDQQQGRLVSPEFTLERPWISFLVGGGGHRGRTCINLVVGGEVVRSSSGNNNERLQAENWSVKDLLGRRARFEILDLESGGWGHINVDQIEFRDEPLGLDVEDRVNLPDYGTMGLALVGEATALVSRRLPDGELPAGLFADRQGALREAGEGWAAMDERLVGAVGRDFELEPGEAREWVFVVAWHAPNLMRDGRRVGNAYARRFGSARAVAEHVVSTLERSTRDTRLWHDTYYDSTLPRWLLDRLGSTVGNLATATCQWWEDGRFWAWEGCGCCHGTCGHVWNYEHALARLFPDLERSVREMQDFKAGVGFNAQTGSIGFRGEGWDLWAGDAQGGYILKAYREHLCSADDGFLRGSWPQIKQAVEFLVRQDGNADGLIEGKQHQTYDQDYYGANTFVGALYLGALRAAERMAERMGERAFAARCRRLADSGASLSMERLFNGEYFIQQVDLKEHPDWQYAEGCLADQMFGQGWAHQVGLGYLYPSEAVRQALAAVWRYCWTPDVASQNAVHPPERWFARPGEGGLFTCTWPKSPHLGPKSTRYRNEVWTGIEYQVAGHMVWEGMLTEGLAICRAVHERYHPAKRNPWNEIECGDHYARALASWGVLTALSGFEYDGPGGRIGFAPRLRPEDYRGVFTAAAGWGRYGQQRSAGRQTGELQVVWGLLRLQELQLSLPEGVRVSEVRLRIGGQEERVQVAQEGTRIQLRFDSERELKAGEAIEVEMAWI